MCVTGIVFQEPRHCVAVYLRLSSGKLTSISFHVCSSWYLLIFLFRDGSLTLIRMVSLTDLAIFCSSLSTKQKFSVDVTRPMML